MIPYPWTFTSQFLTGAIGGIALVAFFEPIFSKAILLCAWAVLYVGGSITLNWWYFRLGQTLDRPN